MADITLFKWDNNDAPPPLLEMPYQDYILEGMIINLLHQGNRFDSESAAL